MKLDQELKDKIDRYFENITAEELYKVSVNKYGFKEDTSFELFNEPFKTLKTEKYSSKTDNSFSSDSKNDSFNLVA